MNSITNTIKTMILNMNLIYVSPGYYTTVPKLLIFLLKVLMLTNRTHNYLWVHLKKKVEKRSPTNKNDLIRFIKEDWLKLPSEYDIPKLIQYMRRRLQDVIDTQGGHTKY